MADGRFFDGAGPFALREIARHIGAEICGSGADDLLLRDVAALDSAGDGDISVYSDRKHESAFAHTGAKVVITSPALSACAHNGAHLLLTGNPRLAFAQVGHLFYPSGAPVPGLQAAAPVHPTARIGEDTQIMPGAAIGAHVTIGARCTIGSNAVIGRGVQIGDDCIIGAGVVISHALIGNRVTLAGNVTLGSAGFSFVPGPNGALRVPQLGRVIIEDDVEMGANCAVDRGAIGDTVIGRGSMFDNLVHIAHNVQIGRHCLIAGQVGIAGSTVIGSGVMMGGQVGISDHLRIGDGARIAAKSGVTRDVGAGEAVGGYPARPLRRWQRETVMLSELASRKPRAT